MENQASSVRVSGVRSIVDRVDKFITTVSKWLYWIAGAGLIAMLVLTVGDIIGIKALAHPIPGGIEMTAFMGTVAIGFAIAYVQVLHGHIQVDFITLKLPPRPKAIIDIIVAFLGMGFFILLAWKSWDYAMIMRNTGEVSMTQKIPFYPFIFGLAFCYLITFLVLSMEFAKTILKVGERWTR